MHNMNPSIPLNANADQFIPQNSMTVDGIITTPFPPQQYDMTSSSLMPPADPKPITQPPQQDHNICKFFHEGKCYKGVGCKKFHNHLNVSLSTVSQQNDVKISLLNSLMDKLDNLSDKMNQIHEQMSKINDNIIRQSSNKDCNRCDHNRGNNRGQSREKTYSDKRDNQDSGRSSGRGRTHTRQTTRDRRESNRYRSPSRESMNTEYKSQERRNKDAKERQRDKTPSRRRSQTLRDASQERIKNDFIRQDNIGARLRERILRIYDKY